MAELVDALDSKSSSGNRVWVRFPLWVQRNNMYNKKKQLRYDIAYMKMALEWANLSYCKRKKVGALIVKDNKIVAKEGKEGTRKMLAKLKKKTQAILIKFPKKKQE